MPIYGEEKTLQMMRSILPSKARKGTREDKRHAKKASRAKIRQALNNYDAERIDYRSYPDVEISNIVWERRAADKLSHFERWAVEITKHLPKEERLPYLKRMLPDNLIGRHAYSHLERIDELGYYWDRYSATRVPVTPFRELLPDLLRGCVVDGSQVMLNRKIKEAHQGSHLVRRGMNFDYKKGEGDDAKYHVLGRASYDVEKCDHCEKPRLFLGLGDIDSFIADIFARHRHSEWRTATSRFFSLPDR